MSCTETAVANKPKQKTIHPSAQLLGSYDIAFFLLFFLFSFFKFTVALCPQRPQRPLGTGSPGLATSSFTQLLSSVIQVLCYFTSTETIRTIRDGLPRTATSTFTRLLSSDIDLREGHHIIRPRRHGIRVRDTLNLLHSLGYRNRYLVLLVRPWTLSSVSTSGLVYRSAICPFRGPNKRCFVCGQCSGPFPIFTYEAYADENDMFRHVVV